MIQSSDEQTCHISNYHRASRENKQLLSVILPSFSSYKLIHVKFNLEKKKKKLVCQVSFIWKFLSKKCSYLNRSVGGKDYLFLSNFTTAGYAWSYNREGNTHEPPLHPECKYEDTLNLFWMYRLLSPSDYFNWNNLIAKPPLVLSKSFCQLSMHLCLSCSKPDYRTPSQMNCQIITTVDAV